nr:MAG TPA: hypothetical protein [Caudoviricetes sp.]
MQSKDERDDSFFLLGSVINTIKYFQILSYSGRCPLRIKGN